MRENACHRILVDSSGGGVTAFVVPRLPRAQPNEIIDQRIARTGIERMELVAIDEGYIRNAAHIEDGDRMRTADGTHHCLVKYRHHRCPLTSGRNIGGAKIIDHRNAEPS